uniref:Putative rna polymerase ii elongation factor ell n=1 Tax=Ornithodoros turicata TaxID=34597 RepID=A0A2R5LKI2_9ACAR
MAALVEGTRYGLSSQGTYSKNKTLIFVKLTDSALRSIEEYLKYKGSCSHKPSIQFDGKQGVITVPRAGSGQQTNQQRFGFGVSTLEKDAPQGSFECVRETGERALDSLGCLLHKMQIHASDDIYEKTRVKMAVVEKESKKNCTKVIKVTSPYVGRKVKVKRPMVLQQTSAPLLARQSPPVVAKYHTQQQPPPQPQQRIPHDTGRSSVARRSYRERIVQLLALRPYKKPELLARLIKDGVREQDRKGLSAILSQVAVLKDNTYSLARHIWSEVRDDWPYYTPEEAELLRNNRIRAELPSPVGGSNSPPEPMKIKIDTPEVPVSKRPRVSLYQQPPQQPPPQPLQQHPPPQQQQPPPQQQQQPPPPQQHRSKPQMFVGSNGGLTRGLSGGNSVPAAGPSPVSSPDSADSIPDGTHDYDTKYVTITNPDQRARYKADFNAEYHEYKTLHSTVEQVSRRFSDLEDNLRQAQEGSDQWHRVREQIMQEYQQNLKDKRYQEARRKLQYLHDKLAHIKRLVLDYDARVRAAS